MTIAKAMDKPVVTPPLEPPDGAAEVQTDPFETNTLPDVPAEVRPVPPFATGSVPDTLAVKLAYVVAVEPVPPLTIGRVPVN